MDVERTTSLRNLIGKAGALFCLIFLVAALDGLVSGARQPDDVLRLLPGESIKINGTLREKLGSVQDLAYTSSSDLIALSFEALHSGFWLGGYMWRGTVELSRGIPAGEYSLSVAPRIGDASKASSVFRVQIYQDYASYRKSDKSFLRRYLDLSPWWVFGCFFFLTCVCFVLVYLLSHRRGSLLAKKGIAEVYLVERVEDGWKIAFGLGAMHGVRSGTEIIVLDQDGSTLANAKVLDSSDTDSTAVVKSESTIRMGCIVSIHGCMAC